MRAGGDEFGEPAGPGLLPELLADVAAAPQALRTCGGRRRVAGRQDLVQSAPAPAGGQAEF
ncbi:hypothetical protein CSQ96_22255 [Janthinobacterium sp. BJB412]|nr:hypothetical protein CSQ96_22255 [Janthinobacterium sp. BJB412]